jgi:hypothetical protein
MIHKKLKRIILVKGGDQECIIPLFMDRKWPLLMCMLQIHMILDCLNTILLEFNLIPSGYWDRHECHFGHVGQL